MLLLLLLLLLLLPGSSKTRPIDRLQTILLLCDRTLLLGSRRSHGSVALGQVGPGIAGADDATAAAGVVSPTLRNPASSCSVIAFADVPVIGREFGKRRQVRPKGRPCRVEV